MHYIERWHCHCERGDEGKFVGGVSDRHYTECVGNRNIESPFTCSLLCGPLHLDRALTTIWALSPP